MNPSRNDELSSMKNNNVRKKQTAVVWGTAAVALAAASSSGLVRNVEAAGSAPAAARLHHSSSSSSTTFVSTTASNGLSDHEHHYDFDSLIRVRGGSQQQVPNNLDNSTSLNNSANEHKKDEGIEDESKTSTSKRKKTKSSKKRSEKKASAKVDHSEDQDHPQPKEPSSKTNSKETASATTTDSHHQQHGAEESSSTSPSTTTSPIVEEILNESDYYKILGLSSSSTSTTTVTARAIQKAYRRRAVQTHPDKTNGDRRAFDMVAEAYEVLSDDNKRAIYDKYGKQGLEQQQQQHGGAHFASAEDLFRSFFGGGSPFGHRQNQQQQQAAGPRRNRTMTYQLEVTLEELYKGASRTVQLENPNLFHQHHHRSAAKKRVQVDIPKGALDGEHVVLSGAMDLDQNETPGDLIFVLRQRPHSIFTRKGYDLACRMDISLEEAICGVERTIPHVNGSSITVSSARRQQHNHHPSFSMTTTSNNATTDDMSEKPPLLIQTGDVQVLKGQGMPKDPQGITHGDLYIQFHVNMPKSTSPADLLTDEERNELSRLLHKLEGKSTKPTTTTKTKISSEQKTSGSDKSNENAENKHHVQFLKPASLSDFGRASGQPRPNQFHGEDDDGVFGGMPSGFASSSFSSFGSSGGRRFYWSSSSSSSAPAGGNPFAGGPFGGSPEEDADTQCRQM